MKEIVLASGSPRRKELLSKIYENYIIDVSNIEEITTRTIPSEVVEELAYMKAMDVSKRHGDNSLIIGADTMVAVDDEILGKPKDKEDSLRMLRLLSGRNHQVYTGVTIISKEDGQVKVISFVEKSEVYVNVLEEKEMLSYIESGEPFDKAGGYGIQGIFGLYISKIEGDYNTIVGFPVARIYKELKKLNVI